jgi:hypothetical protein
MKFRQTGRALKTRTRSSRRRRCKKSGRATADQQMSVKVGYGIQRLPEFLSSRRFILYSFSVPNTPRKQDHALPKVTKIINKTSESSLQSPWPDPMFAAPTAAIMPAMEFLTACVHSHLETEGRGRSISACLPLKSNCLCPEYGSL